MPITVYNTLSRSKEAFHPQDPDRVTLYACGPTVYDYAHIGNARPAVIFDLLRRVLEAEYPQVIYARNITDVDDKINAAAASKGVPIDVITSKYADAYREDMAALGILPPTIEPHATDHIPQMIDMMQRLIASGNAYAAEGHVLFSIESFGQYGQLSRRDMDDMVAGARVEVAPYKRHPGDFVLWKPSEDPLPGWDSPWGWGRPGWHLECSVMCEAHLGETIDIHAGGQDLVFPHHENELAQSTCAHGGEVFARYWMHNGFVTVEGRKMSKSLGNVYTVHDLLQEHPGEVLRFLLLNAHYRQPLDWSAAALTKARRTLDKWYRVVRDASAMIGNWPEAGEPDPEVLAALQDDLNTPAALAAMSVAVRRLAEAASVQEARTAAEKLRGAADLMGLLQSDAEAWFRGEGESGDDAAIQALVEARDAARAGRDFARADALRDELAAMGVILEDNPAGTRWRRGE